MVKHFLDTSVLRPVVTPTSKASKYYAVKLHGESYICEYAKMEYLRGFIIPCMHFHAKVSMPNSDGISDALILWSQKFQSREIKAVMQLMASIRGHFGRTEQDIILFNLDKDFQIKHLGDYIRRLLNKVDFQFKKIGTDSRLCFRSTYRLRYNPSNILESFANYFQDFCDSNNANKCELHLFIQKNKPILRRITQSELSIPKVPKSGFSSLKKSLNQIIEEHQNISCRGCSKIGDAVISILCPQQMVLEHTDYSFDYLAKILEKKNARHPSETKINN